MTTGTKDFDFSQLGQPIEKPYYRCQHAREGRLVAARVETVKATIDMCYQCYSETPQKDLLATLNLDGQRVR